MKTPATILVYVYEDLLGDGILKLPFVRALRAEFPQAHITWCAGGGKSVYTSLPLTSSMLDRVLEIPLGRTWGEIFQQSPLKDRIFDLIIDTQRDLKTTLALKKIPHGAFLSRTASFLFSDFKPKETEVPALHLSQQLIRLLEILKGKPIKAPAHKGSFLEDLKAEIQSYFSTDETYVGLAPGAGNRKKCWPLDRFIEVAHSIENEGKVPVFILGPAEKEWYEILKETVPAALFPLQEKPEFLSNPLYTAAMGFFLEAAVVNDAGVAHLLSLSDTHLISLFGPTKAEKVHPLTPHLTLLKASDFGDGTLMENIPTAPVLEALHHRGAGLK